MMQLKYFMVMFTVKKHLKLKGYSAIDIKMSLLYLIWGFMIVCLEYSLNEYKKPLC